MWIVPSTISPSSLAAEDSTSGSTGLFEALAASLTWRGKATDAASWKRAFKRVSWIRHLCTRMLPWADRLRMLGNGVVPAQAEAAIRFLLPRVLEFTSVVAEAAPPASGAETPGNG
jgi:hypothetical protein